MRRPTPTAFVLALAAALLPAACGGDRPPADDGAEAGPADDAPETSDGAPDGAPHEPDAEPAEPDGPPPPDGPDVGPDAPQDAQPDDAQVEPDEGGSADPDVPDVPIGGGDVEAEGPAPTWTTVFEDLPEAVLSVWTGEGAAGTAEVWLVGADKGAGPLVLRRDAGGWSRLHTGLEGDLWWVHAAGGPSISDSVWMAGAGGRILRFDRPSGALEEVPSGTDATLYGIWGASDDELFAVGGETHPTDGPGVVVRVSNGVASLADDLPAGVSPTATFFKVWGSAADDVWIVGEEATVLHLGASGWSLDPVPGKPRLVTVSGYGDDLVAVGGLGQGVILENGGGVWIDVSPPFNPLLNGVSVSADGRAFAVGLLGRVLERTAAGWVDLPDPPLSKDWHGVRIDQAGDAWVVGGSLISAAAFDEGAVLCWGTTCEEAGPVADVDLAPGPGPEPGPEQDGAGDDADAGGPETETSGGADGGEIDPETGAPDAGLDGGDLDGGDLDGGDLDGGGPGDSGLGDSDLADAGPEGPTGGVSSGELALTLGFADAGAFVPMPYGYEIEIVQGCQGGIHLEPAFTFGEATAGEKQNVALHATTSSGGFEIGHVTVSKFPVTGTGGVWQGGPFVLFFDVFTSDEVLGSPPAPTPATISIEVTLAGGVSGTVVQDVVLVDTADQSVDCD